MARDDIEATPAGSKPNVEKLTSDLAYRVREVETLNGHVAQLTRALDARAAEIETLNRAVAELRGALATRGGEVEALHAALGTRSDEVAALHAALETRAREIETLNRAVAELRAALATRGDEVEALHAALATREGEGEALRAALATRGDEVEALNRTVARLTADLRTRGGEVATLARALETQAREVDTVERAMASPAASARPVADARAQRGDLPADAAGARSTLPAQSKLDMPGLIWTIVRTDLKVRYHGTVGGLLWALLKPLATLAVLLTVFGWLFASSPDYRLRLIIGIVLWEFFAEGTKTGLLSLAAKSHIVGKAVFPRWIVVATSLANPLVPLTVFSVTLLVALLVMGRPPSLAAALAFAGCVCQLALIVLGFSLGASVVFVRYRDLNQVWEVVIQAGFFLAPIVYPSEMVPQRLRAWLQLWPPTAVIEYARTALLERRVPSLEAHALLAGLVAIFLVSGIMTFRRFSPTVAEHV